MEIVLASTQKHFADVFRIRTNVFIGEQHVRYWKSYIMVISLLSYDSQGVYLRFVRFFIADFKLILSGDIDKVEETKNKCVCLLSFRLDDLSLWSTIRPNWTGSLAVTFYRCLTKNLTSLQS